MELGSYNNLTQITKCSILFKITPPYCTLFYGENHTWSMVVTRLFYCIFRAGLGICSSVFRANLLFVSERVKVRFTRFFERITRFALLFSWLLFYERPERITHGRSFVKRHLSESLTVALLLTLTITAP